MDTGTTGGLQSHHHSSYENNDDQFRVVAVDRQGNRRVSPIKLVPVPIDDASHPPLIYTGTWTHGPGDPLDFRATLSSSATPNDTMMLTFTERYVAWVAPGGGNGVASVSTDDGGGGTVMLANFDGHRRIVFSHTFASAGPHSITITVTSGTVPVDGIIVR